MEDIKVRIIEDDAQQRIDKFLTKMLKQYSRTQIQNLIQDNHVKVNGKTIKASYKLEENDEVEIHFPEPENTDRLLFSSGT